MRGSNDFQQYENGDTPILWEVGDHINNDFWITHFF